MEQVVIPKGRTYTMVVKLMYDVSDSVITSQIRRGRRPTSDLIADWQVEFITDGTDGRLLLTLDDSVTVNILDTIGYMDLKRVVDGEPLSVFAEPVQVSFQNVVTV